MTEVGLHAISYSIFMDFPLANKSFQTSEMK